MADVPASPSDGQAGSANAELRNTGLERQGDGPCRSTPATPVSVITGQDMATKLAVVRHVLSNPPMAHATALLPAAVAANVAHPHLVPIRDIAPIPATGCRCCALHGDLQRALRGLLARARRGDVMRVVMISTDQADPADILTTIADDPVIASVFHVDQIICVAAAAQDVAAFADNTPGWRQAALADRAVILGQEQAGATALSRRLAQINPAATLVRGLPEPDFFRARSRQTRKTRPRFHAETVAAAP